MKPLKASARQADNLPDAGDLLAWYDRHARVLPWRVGPAARRAGKRADPYHVWLSEIMLQQTTVAAVRPYFETFTRTWPRIADLAAADRDDIMRAWAGLGYYARARRMKACAEIVTDELGGRFPQEVSDLIALPGIGPYTAAAIAAIAFDQPVAVVDGNVERVLSRLYAIDTPLPRAKTIIRERQARLTPAVRPGDYAQAVMDLGATLCSPSRPACELCPWSPACCAHRAGQAEAFPVKPPKRKRPKRYGIAYVVTRADGAVLMRRRPDDGLLGGMVEVPGTLWRDRAGGDAAGTRPTANRWQRIRPDVRHVFTHFELALTVWRGHARANAAAPDGSWWAARTTLADAGLPSVMRKAVEAALPGATRRTT
ncbi:MAG: A/G-specific adenine glycosylase [Alphaproteobacteria bacterium]